MGVCHPIALCQVCMVGLLIFIKEEFVSDSSVVYQDGHRLFMSDV